MHTSTRPIYLTREGTIFRLAFRYHPDLVERARGLPHARFDPDSKTWQAAVCTQSVEMLRRWWFDGLIDVSVDDLIGDDEQLTEIKPAVLRSGTLKRPYVVSLAFRTDDLFRRFKTIPGAAWDRASASLTYPPSASVALAELVDRGVLDDPARLLTPADVVVAFDTRTGWFSVRGDRRAEAAFAKSFPANDVVAIWRSRGIDVAFSDWYSEEIYRGELARVGDGLVPEGFIGTLYPYQAQSVAMAVERSGFGIFHQMGLGKTVIAIAAGWELAVNRSDVTRVVVVVPGAVRTQWAREITRFTGDDSIVVVDGTKAKREAAYAAAADARWLVVHYDVLHRDLTHITPLVSGALLIADEAHRVKSPTAKRTKAVRSLAHKAARRIALTGTPIDNNPGEWYSIISGYVQPGVFGSPADYFGRYAYPGRFGGYEGARNLAELRERSRTFYIRYTKKQVAPHLPPLRVIHRPLDTSTKYAAALRRAHRDAADEIKRAAVDRVARSSAATGVLDGQLFDEVEAGAEMTAVGMLNLLCLSPRLIWRSDAPSAKALCDADIIPDEDGPKLDELRILCAELQANNQRVVVFTSSRRMTDLIAERFDTDGIRYVTFTGVTSPDDRDAAVAAFNAPGTDDDPGPTVFLATDAGGEGLNLGGQCSLLVNLDIPWTPGRLAQRSARIHRLDGTAERYQVYNFTLRSTIEEGILKLVEHKADLADAIFGETGGRERSTGRSGRSIFEDALDDWMHTNT